MNMRRTRRQTKRVSPLSGDSEDGPKKKKSMESTVPKISDDSSSDSDIENYLQQAKDIDFNSTFFKTTTEKKDFEQIEKDIFSGINQLSDSESDEDIEDTNDQFQVQSQQADNTHKGSISSFEHINVYNKQLEEAKKQIAIYKSRKDAEENLDISNILAIGESKATDNTEGLVGSSDFETLSDSEKEDWQEVDSVEEESVIPTKGVEITVELPGNMRKKKGIDLMAAVRRRLNRVKKENQVLIHKVHILCWIAHGNYVNKILSSENLLGLALSLLPSQQCYPAGRLNLSYLEDITQWFTKTIKIVNKQTEGDLHDVLEQQIFKKEACDNKMFVYIFICILRSLGIRCRLILSLQVEHLRPPLLDVKSPKNVSTPTQSKSSTTVSNKISKNSTSKSFENKSTPTASSKKKNVSVVSTKKISRTRIDLKSKNTKKLKIVNFEDLCSLESDNEIQTQALSKITRDNEKLIPAKSDKTVKAKNIPKKQSKSSSSVSENVGNIISKANIEKSSYFENKNQKDVKSTAVDNKISSKKLSFKVEEDKLKQQTKNDQKDIVLEIAVPNTRSTRQKTNESTWKLNREMENKDKNHTGKEENLMVKSSRELRKRSKSPNEIQKEKPTLKKRRSVSLERLSTRKGKEQEKVLPKLSSVQSESLKATENQNLLAKSSSRELRKRSKSPIEIQKEKPILIKRRSVSLERLSTRKGKAENKVAPKLSSVRGKSSKATENKNTSNEKTISDNKRSRSKSPTKSTVVTNFADKFKIKMPFKLKSGSKTIHDAEKEQTGTTLSSTASIKAKSVSVPQLDGPHDSEDSDADSKTVKKKPNLEKLKNDFEDKCPIKKHPQRLKKIIQYKEIDSDDDFKTEKAMVKKQSNPGCSNISKKMNLNKLKTNVKKLSSQTSSESDKSKYFGSPIKSGKMNFGSPIKSGKMNVKGDIMHLITKSLAEERDVLRSKLVKHKRVPDPYSSDSDYMPELITTKVVRDDFKKKPTNVKRRIPMKKDLIEIEKKKQMEKEEKKKKNAINVWVEVFVEAEEKWISIDVVKGQIHCVKELYTRATHPISYILSWDNDGFIKDVTKRYCINWNTVTRKLRVDDKWLNKSLLPYKSPGNAREREEDEDLARQQLEQPLPTTISEYKNHPLYVLKRHLLKFEGIYPPDALTLGFVRSEPVYSRDCVYVLHSREIWLKEAKVVKRGETPYKIVKARPKYDRLSNSFITDKLLEVFGEWQVEDYVPPTAENGIVPRNAYGNVELFKPRMLPKGTVHLQLPSLNKVARKLNIDCAPAVVGFDFHGGWSHPTFDGFVVCEEFSQKLVAAWIVDQEESEKRAQEKIEKRVYENWRRLIRGLLIRERLKAKYDFGESSTSSKKGKGKSKGSLSIKKNKIHSDSESESEK